MASAYLPALTLKDDSHLVDSRFVLTVATGSALLALDALTPVGLAIWLLQIILMWVTTLWANLRQIRWIAVLSSAFTVLAFWWSTMSGIETWTGVVNLLLSLAAVCAIAQIAMRQRLVAKQAAHVEAENKILTGLLPICASCKNIRDKSGKWEQMETYITQHSEAHFSHSLCQPCAARLYPEFADSL